VRVRHQVDVDVARPRHDGGPHPARPQPRPPAPGAGTHHDLAGIDAARESQNGLGDVVAGDGVELPAQFPGQRALRRDRRTVHPRQPVAAADVHGDQLPARPPRRDPSAAAQHGLPLRAAGERDHHALTGGPGVEDALVGAVALQRLVHPVRQPQQGQLAQRRQVAGPEITGQRGVDLVGLVDVAVRHPAAQRLRRHVDQLDLVGPADHPVGHGLALADPGDRMDRVVEGLQVLDVDRRDDVDARVEEHGDVLVPAAPRRPRHVRVGELVHQSDL
jgi:hypothetical protein